MSANCKCFRKQPSMIIRGNHLCSGCNAAGIRSPGISRRSRTSARRAAGARHSRLQVGSWT